MGGDYIGELRARREREAQTLARLTGRDISNIHARMRTFSPPVVVPPWWDEVFDSSCSIGGLEW